MLVGLELGAEKRLPRGRVLVAEISREESSKARPVYRRQYARGGRLQEGRWYTKARCRVNLVKLRVEKGNMESWWEVLITHAHAEIL